MKMINSQTGFVVLVAALLAISNVANADTVLLADCPEEVGSQKDGREKSSVSDR